MTAQGRGGARAIAVAVTAAVHIGIAAWLLRTGPQALVADAAPALEVVWLDAAPPPSPPAADRTEPPATPRRAAPGPVPRAPSAPRAALQAVEVQARDASRATGPAPSLEVQARAFARAQTPPGTFERDPLRHRPPPAPDGRFAMRDPVSAEDVVNGIGALLFGGGPSDPCPRIRRNLANADMGAGRALAEEELRRLHRDCL